MSDSFYRNLSTAIPLFLAFAMWLFDLEITKMICAAYRYRGIVVLITVVVLVVAMALCGYKSPLCEGQKTTKVKEEQEQAQEEEESDTMRELAVDSEEDESRLEDEEKMSDEEEAWNVATEFFGA